MDVQKSSGCQQLSAESRSLFMNVEQKPQMKRPSFAFTFLLMVVVVAYMTALTPWQKDMCLGDLDNQEAIEVI